MANNPKPLVVDQKEKTAGGKAEFTLGSDIISLERNNEIAPGHAPYRL
jgi:hypothetical protein